MIEHISRNIYIGNSKDAADLRAMRRAGIGAVINCAAELPVFSKSIHYYLHLYILPHHKFTFQEALVVVKFYEFIKNLNVLVHCHVGMERSPSVAILILMYLGYSYSKAHRIVASHRTEVPIRIYSEVKKFMEQTIKRRLKCQKI